MLRLTIKAHTSREVVLTVAGWITGVYVRDLSREMEHWREHTQHLILELTDVRAIDEGGLGWLQHWTSPTLELRGDSVYLRALLAGVGLKLNPPRE